MTEQVFGLSAADIATLRDMRRLLASFGGSIPPRGSRPTQPGGFQPSILRGSFVNPWGKGEQHAVETNAGSIAAWNYFVDLAGNKPGGTTCAIAFTGEEWILISAECE